MKILILFANILMVSDIASAELDPCAKMLYFDPAMQMCMPLAMKEMPMKMIMLQGNAFLTAISAPKPRGENTFAVPDSVMIDMGRSIGEHHYLNLDVMATSELWNFPERGYPELLQIGEQNNQGIAYVDTQHPHSSPIMGLTLSDTIRLDDNKNNLKVFFAPRGESTDGPVSFMHRATAEVNPDVPLGHHIGQDVGHITSTVLGMSLKFFDHQFEISAFHGAEPQPQKVDLPLGRIDSYAFRYIRSVDEHTTFMISYAEVSDPEPEFQDILSEQRFSASIYHQFQIGSDLQFQNSLIWGSISNYDHVKSLTSFTEEFVIKDALKKLWGRFECLQRNSAELDITTNMSPSQTHWVEALTLGYTQNLTQLGELQLAWGSSLTADFLPPAFQSAYGNFPLTAKLFIQLSGMKMWHLHSESLM